MTVITMSRDELTRLRVLIDIADGRLSVADTTGLIGVGRRQIYRLLNAFRAGGPDGLISQKRGRPSNRALGTVFRETVLSIVRERYADFGPTLAAEKLSELHGLDLGVETLRQWMIGAGRPRHCGQPPAARHQQVEQDRAPPLLLHQPKLACQATRQLSGHRRADLSHHYQNWPHRALRTRPRPISQRHRRLGRRDGRHQHRTRRVPRRVELHHLTEYLSSESLVYFLTSS
jgi:hypothetical protein